MDKCDKLLSVKNLQGIQDKNKFVPQPFCFLREKHLIPQSEAVSESIS